MYSEDHLLTIISQLASLNLRISNSEVKPHCWEPDPMLLYCIFVMIILTITLFIPNNVRKHLSKHKIAASSALDCRER